MLQAFVNFIDRNQGLPGLWRWIFLSGRISLEKRRIILHAVHSILTQCAHSYSRCRRNINVTDSTCVLVNIVCSSSDLKIERVKDPNTKNHKHSANWYFMSRVLDTLKSIELVPLIVAGRRSSVVSIDPCAWLQLHYSPVLRRDLVMKQETMWN